MTCASDDEPKEREDDSPIAIDAYGIKARIHPGPDVEAPQTWLEVRDRLNHLLMRLAVAPVTAVVDILEGVGRVVRGVAAMPAALTKRVGRAHSLADRREQERQARVSPDSVTGISAGSGDRDEVVARLEKLLEKNRHTGRDAQVVGMPDGRILVLFGTPEESRALIEAAAAEPQRLLPSERERS